MEPDIEAHYALGFERARLRRENAHRLEFVRTWELLERYLPPPPARVCGVGGPAAPVGAGGGAARPPPPPAPPLGGRRPN